MAGRAVLTSPVVRTGSGPVCVITTDGDITADRVVLELAEAVPVIRFDLADFPSRARLDASFDGARWAGTLTARGRTVRLEEIGSIWWWHPGLPDVSKQSLAVEEAEWVRNETVAGVAGTLASLDCLHLNHPVATRAAQIKPDVLVQAARSGLAVPPTWVGNRVDGAHRFATGLDGPVVVKSLVSPVIDYHDGHNATFYTTRLDPDILNESITACAHQLQSEIDKAFEVRLAVVGREMFAARIDAHSAAAAADFRSDYDHLTYTPTVLPGHVRSGVWALMDHYRLDYAAIDLIVDDDGQWWLVDLNPAGQFDWIPAELPELEIVPAMARLLTHGTTSPHPWPTPTPSMASGPP
ncbi:MvdC/MvdD family ATP grasp protein [Streptomyces sp. NPDC057638]|uniref:MvdC/MvdD family ATP grasp protein n=1 Tax=Streptomyces sp. NPDC057638 TaxID=3346190 RepID=UPI0036A6792F